MPVIINKLLIHFILFVIKIMIIFSLCREQKETRCGNKTFIDKEEENSVVDKTLSVKEEKVYIQCSK